VNNRAIMLKDTERSERDLTKRFDDTTIDWAVIVDDGPESALGLPNTSASCWHKLEPSVFRQ